MYISKLKALLIDYTTTNRRRLTTYATYDDSVLRPRLRLGMSGRLVTFATRPTATLLPSVLSHNLRTSTR